MYYVCVYESEGDEEHEHAEEMRLLARLVMEWIVQVLEKCMYVCMYVLCNACMKVMQMRSMYMQKE